jgi:hypothetical protein
VTARALSGLIVVLVGYIVLAASGLLGLPNPIRLISALLVVGVGALIMWPWVKLSQWVIKTINKIKKRWLRISATSLWFIVFLAVLLYIMLVAQSVAMWAYNSVPT